LVSTFSFDWVEHAIAKAVETKASDIHIEPVGRGYEVRLRIDGELQRSQELLPCDVSALQRIKVLAELDIAERRLPQDGSFQVQTMEGSLDIRVASLPTVNGEKLVLRLLRHTAIFEDLAALQMPPAIEHAMRRLLRSSRGMLIVTGPTGSGKTSTLLAALHHLRMQSLNIVTLEDPVESRISNVNQVQINERAGLTFAAGLRSILRQDPDVIMIGEIRDGETAEIAVRAALTGHLVLTTMHAETMEGALLRLVDLGVEAYLVASAVKALLTQRLVRLTEGGRKAIFDMIPVDRELQDWLLSGGQSSDYLEKGRASLLCSSLRELIDKGEVLPSEYSILCEGEDVCSVHAEDGKMNGDSRDFQQDWPASCEVV
jgi:type IV pilus assembly protein PilB